MTDQNRVPVETKATTTCTGCGKTLPEGSQAIWVSGEAHGLYHPDCAPPEPAPVLEEWLSKGAQAIVWNALKVALPGVNVGDCKQVDSVGEIALGNGLVLFFSDIISINRPPLFETILEPLKVYDSTGSLVVDAAEILEWCDGVLVPFLNGERERLNQEVATIRRILGLTQ